MSDNCTIDAASRLKRIEGQIRGISKMFEEDRGCEEILMQISAASASLTSIARMLLEHHIEHCVVDAIRSGEDEQILKNLRKTIEQFTKRK